MSKYAGTKTEKNLIDAFTNESRLRNKYVYYALSAKKAGNHSLADVFLELAANEEAHAKIWFDELHAVHSTTSALSDAAGEKNFQRTDLYARMAREARDDGFDELATKFDEIAKIEATYEAHLRELLAETV